MIYELYIPWWAGGTFRLSLEYMYFVIVRIDPCRRSRNSAAGPSRVWITAGGSGLNLQEIISSPDHLYDVTLLEHFSSFYKNVTPPLLFGMVTIQRGVRLKASKRKYFEGT